ncbi:urease accessory protein UreF [Pseudanabaena sp. UWO310]|uniref:urease accessory protein UreF n=1 Tax=Pseudanabaena sp. UWO310 TaxID=2480795 RepID=UPI001158AFEE|nr:urease accessory protein UreF [Pseudanabaena sp. UWO310]TYQ27485.1 urease accessory protein UreF [Pseudanabaena sp. UWO310]
MIINPASLQLLRLLQITSPALPVGAYSYSEGLEYLCSQKIIQTESDLCNWLRRELQFGFIPNETAIALRAHQAIKSHNISTLIYWNDWLSATREAEEVRLASWQMGQSLMKLWWQLTDRQNPIYTSIHTLLPTTKDNPQGKGCNYAIAFGIVAASLDIDSDNTSLGYIYSWLSNLVSAAVRSVPFGQTTGQQVIFQLSGDMLNSSQLSLHRLDNELEWCGWGASLACANHETQYSRLFRS